MDRERERGKARESERGGKRRGGGGIGKCLPFKSILFVTSKNLN